MRQLTHVITTLDPGGAENALLDLVTGLQAKDWEQKVIFLKGQGSLRDQFERKSVPVSKVSIDSFSDLTQCLRRLKSHLKQTQIIHSHLLKANSLAALTSEKKPLVGTRHNDENILNKFFIGHIHQRLSQREARHIAISEAVKQFYVEKGLRAERFVVIPYGFSRSQSAQVTDLHEMFDFPKGSPILLHAGRLVEQKGQKFLLEALANWPEAHLILCGEGPLRPKLEQQTNNLNLQSRVRFLGFYQDLPPLIASADLFVLPSLWEGLGRVLLEAMDLGCPVVATQTSAIPEVLGDTAWLCPPGDSKALTQALKQAWSEQTSWPERCQAMRERLNEKFSMQKMIESHHQLYLNLLND